MDRPKVIVMGGSLGGLTAALFLSDLGYAVTVFERAAEPLTGRGAGIVLNPATVRYFTRQGRTADVQQMSTLTHWVRYLDEQGMVVAERPDSYRFTSYNAIYRGLLDVFETEHYHLDHMVTGFEQDEQGVTVELAAGRTERCDLLVCADGIRSTARNILIGDVALEYAGYVAWRGVLHEDDVAPALAEALDDAIIYHILANGHVLIYPIPVVDRIPGKRETFINWLWYRNVPQGPDFEALMTDQEGRVRDVSLGPGTVRPENIESLHQDGKTMLPALLSDLILKTNEPFVQAVMDYHAPQMAFGRVCLMGDAAFVGRPHAAVGTAKAAEDAWQLSQALEAAEWNVVNGLRAWEKKQLEVGRLVVQRNQEAGRQLQNGTWPVGSRLAFGLYETGDSIMS